MRNMTSFMILITRLLTLLLLAHSLVTNPIEKSWTYSFLEMYSNSTNPDLFRIDMKMVRVGRGDYAMSGDMEFSFEVDDTFETEMLVYRSPDGSAEYKLEPIAIPRQSFLSVMNKFYKTLVMNSIKDCSNMPQFADSLKNIGPVLYTMDKCKIKTDALPNNLPVGYYKLYFNGFGPVEFTWYMLVHIEKRHA